MAVNQDLGTRSRASSTESVRVPEVKVKHRVPEDRPKEWHLLSSSQYQPTLKPMKRRASSPQRYTGQLIDIQRKKQLQQYQYFLRKQMLLDKLRMQKFQYRDSIDQLRNFELLPE